MVKEENTNKMNKTGPIVTGVLLGALLSGAYYLFSNKNKRKQAAKKLNELKNKTTGVVDDLKDTSEEFLNSTQEKLENGPLKTTLKNHSDQKNPRATHTTTKIN